MAPHGGSTEQEPFAFHHKTSGEANGMESECLSIARAKLGVGFDDLVRLRVLRGGLVWKTVIF